MALAPQFETDRRTADLVAAALRAAVSAAGHGDAVRFGELVGALSAPTPPCLCGKPGKCSGSPLPL